MHMLWWAWPFSLCCCIARPLRRRSDGVCSCWVARRSRPLLRQSAYDIGVGPNTISTLPIVFAMMLPIYAWLIIGEQIIEFAPVAYETVFQNMQDPVIVVDDQQRIIGLNHGAEALLDLREQDALRESLDQVFGEDASEVHAALDTGKPQKNDDELGSISAFAGYTDFDKQGCGADGSRSDVPRC